MVLRGKSRKDTMLRHDIPIECIARQEAEVSEFASCLRGWACW